MIQLIGNRMVNLRQTSEAKVAEAMSMKSSFPKYWMRESVIGSIFCTIYFIWLKSVSTQDVVIKSHKEYEKQ